MSQTLYKMRCFFLALVVAASAETEFCDDCDDAGLSLRQLRGMKQAGQWNFTSPDPDRLVWDNIVKRTIKSTSGPYNVTVYNGWLKVPLVHDPALMEYEMPPEVCLRVRGIAALKQPAKNGPLLAHCGGPGSGRSCALGKISNFFDMDGKHGVISNFDLLSIDQRGINISDDSYEDSVKPCPFEQSGKKIQPFPTIYCDEISQKLGDKQDKVMPLLMSRRNLGSSSSALWNQYVKRILDNNNVPSTEYFNKSFAQWYYRVLKLEHNLCFQAPRYQLKAPNGRAYNALRFVGTVDLANDLKLLRQAIGTEQMSLYGGSYGTKVAAVYASIFPSSTFRVVMSGVTNPMPNAAAEGDLAATGMQAYWDGMVQDCDDSLTPDAPKDQVCPAAPNAGAKAMSILKGDDKDQVGSLRRMITATIFQKVRGKTVKVDAMAPLLMACIEQFDSGKDVEGCKIGLNAVNNGLALLSSSSRDRFGDSIIAAVLGTDIAGRLDEDEFLAWWMRTKDRLPIGLSRGMNRIVSIGTWPSYARPIPPVGSSRLSPVIIGNLHDPNTGYEFAQKMKAAFPDGYLVTFQGYGHCLNPEDLGAQILKTYQEFKANKTLPPYTNSIAKYACLAKVLSYLETGEGITDGHTCVMPKPLSLGSAAVKAHKSIFKQ